jgi:hypothetical protein
MAGWRHGGLHEARKHRGALVRKTKQHSPPVIQAQFAQDLTQAFAACAAIGHREYALATR